MHPPISAEQWTALRALREGAPPVFPLLASAASLYPSTIRERASREGWRKLDLPRARAIQAALAAPPVTPAEAEEQVAAARAAVEGPGEGGLAPLSWSSSTRSAPARSRPACSTRPDRRAAFAISPD